MNILFYVASVVAILATGLAITRSDAVHALLYLIVSLLAVAMIFLLLGAPFAAALEVIIYAGAIIVLFIFVVMMLDKGWTDMPADGHRFPATIWGGPAVLSVILFMEFLYVFASQAFPESSPAHVGPKDVGISLLHTYIVGVELASMLLLAGLVGAYYLGRRLEQESPE